MENVFNLGYDTYVIHINITLIMGRYLLDIFLRLRNYKSKRLMML